MATAEQKKAATAAVQAALDAASSADRANSPTRFVLMLDAALPLLMPAPVESPPPSAILALTVVPKTDELKQRLVKLYAETEALWNDSKQAP